MALGKLFKSLFGGGGGGDGGAKQSAAEPVEYKGFSIIPEPVAEGGQFRTAGRICKEVAGELKETPFIRADNNSTLEASVDHCVQKGKQIIDEQGEAVLDRGHA